MKAKVLLTLFAVAALSACTTIDSGSIGSNRAEFEGDVRKRLEKSLREEGFVVEEFIAQITPPESLRKAIDAKNEAV